MKFSLSIFYFIDCGYGVMSKTINKTNVVKIFPYFFLLRV